MCIVACVFLCVEQEAGCTPLFRAAQEGDVTIVATLLAHPDVDVNKATVRRSCFASARMRLLAYHTELRS